MDVFLKKIKKVFFKVFSMSSANDRYIRRPAVFESIISADPAKLFIVTVAFNNADLIALHHAALQKNMVDAYEYFVVDNSTDPDEAEKTKAFCFVHRVNYIRLPENPGLDGSLHHGFALNWIYRNLIEKYKPVVFGFMDNDLFPMKPISILAHLEHSDSWGIITKRKLFLRPWRARYYWWMGLWFYRFAYFKSKRPNFLPAFGFDTGGRIAIDDPVRALLFPDVHDLSNSPTISDAPGDRVFQYGDFIHFTGAAWDLPELLEQKRRWIAARLDIKI